MKTPTNFGQKVAIDRKMGVFWISKGVPLLFKNNDFGGRNHNFSCF